MLEDVNIRHQLIQNHEIEYDHDDSDNIPYTIVCCILILLIILGNGTILAIVIWRKELKTHRMIYIVSLVTSDLMVATIVIPLAITTQYKMFVMTSIICKISECLKYLTVTANLYCVVAIATDRHQVITSIFKARPSRARPFLFVIFVWMFAAVYSLRPAFTHGMTSHEDEILPKNGNIMAPEDQQANQTWNIRENGHVQGTGSWDLLESGNVQGNWTLGLAESGDVQDNHTSGLVGSGNVQRNQTLDVESGNVKGNQMLDLVEGGNVHGNQTSGLEKSGNVQGNQTSVLIESGNAPGNETSGLLESGIVQGNDTSGLVESGNAQGNDTSGLLESGNAQGNDTSGFVERGNVQNNQTSSLLENKHVQGNQTLGLLESGHMHDNQTWELLEHGNQSRDKEDKHMHDMSYEKHYTCGLETESLRRPLIMLDFIIICLLPLLVISVLYIRVIHWLVRQRRHNCAVSRSKNQNVKLIQMVLVIVLTYTVCQLPSHIFLMYVYFGPGVDADAEFIYDILTIFTYFNSILNVCIYSLLDSRINVFAKMIFCCRRRMTVPDIPSISQTPTSQRKVTSSSSKSSPKHLNTSSYL